MPYKVLIVDDSRLARMVVVQTLTALRPEWKLVEATGAHEALKLTGEAAPDLALLDVNMIGPSGLELATELRRTNSQMPMAFISANGQPAVRLAAADLGAQFLQKPLNEQALADFLAVAEQALQKKRR